MNRLEFEAFDLNPQLTVFDRFLYAFGLRRIAKNGVITNLSLNNLAELCGYQRDGAMTHPGQHHLEDSLSRLWDAELLKSRFGESVTCWDGASLALPLVPRSSSDEAFAMSLDWLPSDDLELHLRLCGCVGYGEIALSELNEFISYWMTSPGEYRTQDKWTRAFAMSLAQKRRSRGNNRIQPVRQAIYHTNSAKTVTAEPVSDNPAATKPMSSKSMSDRFKDAEQ